MEALATTIVLVGLAAVGCSSPGIIGEWHCEVQGKPCVMTFVSDGTGDATEQGKPLQAVKWKQAGDGFEVTITGVGITLLGTLQENGTLALAAPDDPKAGVLIMKRSQGNR
jgi:hypothetical protein